MNFKQFSASDNQWHDVPYYIHKTDTDTITTLPADIYTDGNNATVGISGNMSQSGTPTPTTPIQPQETGDRTGNLVRFYKEEMQERFYGVDVTVKNAEITLNGTVTIGSGHWVEIGYKFGGGTESTDNVVIPCEPETPYTIATEILDGDSTQVRIIAFGTSNENRTVNIGSSSTTTFSSDINRIFISLGAEGVVFNNLKFRVMFNKGSAPLPYEPYGQYKIPISSANTTTPVYLGEVQTTRQIRKVVFDGTENWKLSSDTNIYITLSPNQAVSWSTVISTHFTKSQVQTNGNLLWFVNANVDFDTVEECKTYLAAQYAAGTPVTVWYVLATEKTGIVNEPIRKIGDYADTVSMEQAGVEIPTVKGNTVIDVETELKPSEIEIEYTGWHDASVHEKSRNLFDEDYTNISGTIQYRPIYVGSGNFTLSTTIPYDLSVANIFLLNGDVTSGASTLGNGAWLNHNVTAQSVDGYVTIAYRHYSGTTSPVDCQTMLNTGSTALPYEPYWK